MKLWTPFLVALPIALVYACSGSDTPDTDSGTPDATEVDATKPADAGRDREQADVKDPDQAEVPVVSSITPTKALVGSQAVDVVVIGRNFVPRTILQLEGAPLVTRFQSTTQLSATIPASAFAKTGTLHISAGTSPPGGGASNELTVAVENPAPSLTAITVPSPPSVLVGANDTPIEVQGANFVDGSVLSFAGTDLPTTFSSASKLTAVVPKAKLANSGTFPVTVRTPAPGGGTSFSISFTVANPQVSITSVTPTSMKLGDPQTQILVKGSGFVSQSAVSLNGTPVVTTFVDGTTLTALVPVQAQAGQFPIVVQNPAPGASVSQAKLFTVEYPVPTVTTVSPNNAVAGGAAVAITVTGAKFYANSQISIDGNALPTTFVDATTLRATIPSASLNGAKTIAVRVVNPAPGGGASTALNFVVGNAVPTIASLNPSGVTVGQKTTVTVNGDKFVAGAQVLLNNVPQTTTVLSTQQVSFSITWPTRGAVPVAVQNPAPGGGLSNTLNLGVGCDTSGVEVVLNGYDPISVNTNFDQQGRKASFDGNMPQKCDATANAVVPTINANFTQPVRAVVVQNVTGSFMDLTTWAVCAGVKDDAYLAVYRRATVPTAYANRRACEGYVSEGYDLNAGSASYQSPERGPALFCPGFTKANGGQVRLDVCEKAVIYLQAFEYQGANGFTVPATLKIKGEQVP